MCVIVEYSDCLNGSIRLVRASSANDGVVEICVDGVWGSITPSGWDYREAQVVCRQLGLPWESKFTHVIFNIATSKYTNHAVALDAETLECSSIKCLHHLCGRKCSLPPELSLES